MAKEWYAIKETHGSFGMKIVFLLMKILPPAALRFLAFPVGFFYWIFSKQGRLFSRNYLDRLESFEKSKNGGKVSRKSTLKHIISFALNLVENTLSWDGKISDKILHYQDDDIQDIIENIKAKRGTLLLISHLGNAQLMRGMASFDQTGFSGSVPMTVIADFGISAGFNDFLSKINPEEKMNVIDANEIGPGTIGLLQEKLDAGEVVVIAGDRVGAHSDRTIEIDFLGKKAAFPYGTFFLVSLLKVPTYFMWGLKQKAFSVRPQYDFFIKKNPVDFDCPRKEREERIVRTAQNYAAELERHCLDHPYQWYNFYDFWA